ncbi:MAG: UDP-N-acetylglucosamine 2-epimerase (non-hydrolyzing) [Armatimonadetes bacterium]|nr:UDP-N-acetylglucosamine 2-epimerase (non-hydrolyzing) [Armatimonadota bacterium]MDI9603604.1 UDP-N-acetylglucosamine 2-epimerase (non-hydrolyzing) [Acidobacteriota bacterium]NLN90333.1 UDP-N-acetylglucosamine 2-epimerase (non-hydrolyzing) [candidate division WS1 bacterium]
MSKPKIVCVVGTRPDAIKTAPVVLELRRFADRVDTLVVSTGQHREMLQQVFECFGLAADHDLDIMQHGQTLAQVTCRALEGIDRILEELRPDFLIAQGDTTTTFVGALAAFYRKVPFGHVEAGLRTGRVDDPFPEEFNRRAASLVTVLHFPPTRWAADNLRSEGINEEAVLVTGNTCIDAVLQVAERHPQDWLPEVEGRVILLTTHRRENWGGPQRSIATAALELLDRFPDTHLAVPMHKNPVVRETLTGILGGHDRVTLMEPPAYPRFVKLMQRSHLILTDSGGVQEEAPAFGIPVLVLRETTERPEGVTAGNARLIGANRQAIVDAATELLTDEAAYAAMSTSRSPYGDGRAAARIRHAVLGHLGIESPAEEPWVE